MGFYYCPYILRTGKVCNKGCYRPEGCSIHWKAPNRVPCNVCGKLTSSKYNICRKHSGKYRSQDNYNKKKLVKMAQKREKIEEILQKHKDGITRIQSVLTGFVGQIFSENGYRYLIGVLG